VRVNVVNVLQPGPWAGGKREDVHNGDKTVRVGRERLMSGMCSTLGIYGRESLSYHHPFHCLSVLLMRFIRLRNVGNWLIYRGAGLLPSTPVSLLDVHNGDNPPTRF